MPRVTIHVPNDTYNKITKMASDNDDSLSSTFVKLAEIGLIVKERQNESGSRKSASDIEEHCQKLILQINALMKSLVAKQMGYSDEDFLKLRDATIDKYNEICGIQKEDL